MRENAAAVIVKVENSVQSHCWSMILHDRRPSAMLLHTGGAAVGRAWSAGLSCLRTLGYKSSASVMCEGLINC